MADELHLPVDRGAGGEASGGGGDAHALVFPATIAGLAIQGRAFPAIDALAMDMSKLSASDGRRLDGVLGHRFLVDKTVWVDYEAQTIEILERADESAELARSCHRSWSMPLESYADETTPVIRDFHFGAATAPISLDTGASGGIALYQSAFALPGIREALVEQGTTSYAGARGRAATKTYALQVPVGFGPFRLPAGQVVTLRDEEGSLETRVANVGNLFLAEITPRILFDYRGRRITFYRDCTAR